MTDRRTLFNEGIKLLTPFMKTSGFSFHFDGSGSSSGGQFARGRFTRNDRTLELHFRVSLGLVTYRIGTASLGHEHYMRLLGAGGRNRYPGFSDDPLQAFRDLEHDLRNFCTDFLTGSGEEFQMLAKEFESNPKMFSGLPD